MSNLPTNTPSMRSLLWDHLSKEHGLTLLQSELDEIVRIARIPDAPNPVAHIPGAELCAKGDRLAPEPAGECKDCDKLMTERDEAEEMCDKLADAIADLTGAEIGEHSSGNFPWQNALEAAEEAGPMNPSQLLHIVECASQVEVDYTADDDAIEFIEGMERLRELLRPWRAARTTPTKPASPCPRCGGYALLGGACPVCHGVVDLGLPQNGGAK